jgi:microcystin-dependent protein
MADQYVGEIRIFPFNFAPRGWATCDGQLLPINQNTALFSLLGINYGGDGRSTFGLPKLNGAATMGFGSGPGLTTRNVGDVGGTPNVTLLAAQLPSHTHTALGKASATQKDPNGQVWGDPGNRKPAPKLYASTLGSAPKQMNNLAFAATGNNQPHNNLMPYLVMVYCIALQGIFPPRG